MRSWRPSLDQDTVKASRVKVIVNADRCKGCELCVEYCPRNILKISSSSNIKGYHYPEVTDESRCANCRFCQALCPEFAIFTVNGK